MKSYNNRYVYNANINSQIYKLKIKFITYTYSKMMTHTNSLAFFYDVRVFRTFCYEIIIELMRYNLKSRKRANTQNIIDMMIDTYITGSRFPVESRERIGLAN